jgi:beta-phosphoglucomutase-like phosphatase (HAD superfamily)
MTLVKAVFLYIDGTLMETNYLHVEASVRALEGVRDPVPRAVIHEQIGKGSDKLISSLSERGYGVWFAASAEPEELKHHMEALGVEGKIAGVVSSGDAEESKPSPDIFALALERAGVFPEDAVIVGDSVWDVEAAKEAGVRTAAVMTGCFQSRRAGGGGGLRGLQRLPRTTQR